MARCPQCHRRLANGAPCPTDGRVAAGQENATDPGPPPEVAGYTIRRAIGAGGFAAVWEAEAGNGAVVALKLALVSSEVSRLRFAREAEAMRRVGAPWVPVVFADGCLADGRPFIAMEKLSGPTLATLLEGLVSPAEVRWSAKVMDELLKVLGAMNASGIVHRDLKPENIFVVEKPARRVVVTDFGLTPRVALTDALITEANARVGTPAYMAPEQFSAAPFADHRSDLYAAGVIFYELLTLRVPFGSEPAIAQHGHSTLRPPHPGRFAAVPESLAQFVLRCLAKNPDGRPADAAAARKLLRAALGDLSDTQPQRGGSDMTTLTTRLQPVILLAADSVAAADEVARVAQTHGGFVARQWGRRAILGFLGVASASPHEAAIGAARELVRRWSGRCAATLVSLRVRRPEGVPAVFGAAVDKPEAWIPTDWSGFVLTEAFAHILPSDAAGPVPGLSGFFGLAEEGKVGHAAPEPELVGRETLLASARTSVETAVATATPGLFTVWGGMGTGKSRAIREIAAVVRAVMPAGRVLELRATRSGVGDAQATASQLDQKLAAAGGRPPLEVGAMRDPLAAMRALAERLNELARQAPLALLVDDAHHADDVTLDALEYATLNYEGTPLWVALSADASLAGPRPQWGRRAHRFETTTLEPLEEAAAMKLAAQLLLPAEYPPLAVLKRLAEWAGGNPFHLTEIAAAVKRAGMIRKRDGAESWYVATVEIDRLPAAAAAQWLAIRELDVLPPELAAHVHLCAVLGDTFASAEVAWVQDALEREGAASTPAEAEAGIRELLHRGIYIDVGKGRYGFRSAAMREAVYNLMGAGDRKTIHRQAFRFWQDSGSGNEPPNPVLEAVARHGAACDEKKVAAQAHVTLGDRARAEHRPVIADNHYSAALALFDDQDVAGKMAALAGRGRMRYRFYRAREAYDDLKAGESLAAATGDRARLLDFLFEQATALDWNWDFAGSAEIVQRLGALMPADPTRAQLARMDCARGRTHLRHARWVEAVPLLEQAAASAGELGDHDTRIVALLMLAFALNHLNRYQDTERCYETLIKTCEETGDRLHLTASYNNRIMYRAYRGQLLDGIDDARRAVALSRELGNPLAERTATYNLAEMLLWAGEEGQALTHARRCKELQERFLGAHPEDAVLTARVLMMRGDRAGTKEQLHWVESRDWGEAGLPEVTGFFVRLLHLVECSLANGELAADDWDARWKALRDQAMKSAPGAEYIELLYWQAKTAQHQAATPRLMSALEELRRRNTANVLATRIREIESSCANPAATAGCTEG